MTHHGAMHPIYQSDEVEYRQPDGILDGPSVRRHITALQQYCANIRIVADEFLGQTNQLLLNLVAIEVTGAFYDIAKLGQVLGAVNDNVR